MNFIWDLYQQQNISETKAEAAQAKHELGRSADRVRELEFAVHRMALASQAMWELVRSKVDVTEAELLQKINEIDLRDGTKDQRMSPRLSKCPKCSRTLSTKNSRCIYCGTEVPKPHVFQ